MKRSNRNLPMHTRVKIIYAWLLLLFVLCGIGVWVFTVHPLAGLLVTACAGAGLVFWTVYTIKNWKCPHCGRDMPGLYYCKYCGKNLDEGPSNE